MDKHFELEYYLLSIYLNDLSKDDSIIVSFIKKYRIDQKKLLLLECINKPRMITFDFKDMYKNNSVLSNNNLWKKVNRIKPHSIEIKNGPLSKDKDNTWFLLYGTNFKYRFFGWFGFAENDIRFRITLRCVPKSMCYI